MERNCKNCKNPDCFWTSMEDDEICDEYLPKTNADRIRSMTNEELADFLWNVACNTTPIGYYNFDGWFVWLKEENQ